MDTDLVVVAGVAADIANGRLVHLLVLLRKWSIIMLMLLLIT
jgi:hypothetical protein